jgi:hypothetical protein
MPNERQRLAAFAALVVAPLVMLRCFTLLSLKNALCLDGFIFLTALHHVPCL